VSAVIEKLIALKNHLITVLVKVSRQHIHTIQSFGFQLFKKKDVVVGTRVNLKQARKIKIQAQAGIYEVLVHPISALGQSLNCKISAYEEQSKSQEGTSILGSGDTETRTTQLHHEVAHSVAQEKDWISERFIIYGRTNITTPFSTHIVISVSAGKTKNADATSLSPPDYGIYVYRVGDDTRKYLIL